LPVHINICTLLRVSQTSSINNYAKLTKEYTVSGIVSVEKLIGRGYPFLSVSRWNAGVDDDGYLSFVCGRSMHYIARGPKIKIGQRYNLNCVFKKISNNLRMGFFYFDGLKVD
jgi:hypothetical protein